MINKNNSYIFYMAYFLVVISMMFKRVAFLTPILPYIKYVAIGLILLNFFIQSKKYSKKELLIIVSTLVIIIPIVFLRDDFDILILFLFIMFSKDISFDDLVKKDFKIRLIFVITIVLFHFLGLTNDYFAYRGEVVRSSMGFAHPNEFGYYLMMVCLELVYIRKNKFKFIDYLFIILSVLGINYYADSRTSIAIIISTLVFSKLFNKSKIFNIKLFAFMIKNSFLIFTILTFVLNYLYINLEFGEQLNIWFSNRLMYNNFFLETYQISFFGNNLILIDSVLANSLNTVARILDNSYLYIILKYGVSCFLLFAYFYYNSFKKMINQGNFILIVIFIILLIYGVMERGLLLVGNNVFLLYFGSFLYSKVEGGKYENKEFN